MSSFKDELNTGLTWRFQLEENGVKTYDKWVDDGNGNYIQVPTTVKNKKFELIGGTKKAGDNVTMLFGFIGWFRIYYPDFVPQMLELLQQPTSIVYSMKSVVIGKLKKIMAKYIPEIDVAGISMVYDYRDRKLFTLAVDYTFQLEEKENFTVVRFLQI